MLAIRGTQPDLSMLRQQSAMKRAAATLPYGHTEENRRAGRAVVLQTHDSPGVAAQYGFEGWLFEAE